MQDLVRGGSLELLMREQLEQKKEMKESLGSAMKLLEISHQIRQNVYLYMTLANEFEELNQHEEIMEAAACVIALKQWNEDRKLRDIVNSFYYVRHSQVLPINSTFWKLKDSLIRAEFVLLRAIGFQTEAADAYSDLCLLIDDLDLVERGSNFLQTSIYILNDVISLSEANRLLQLDQQRNSKVRVLTRAVIALTMLFTSTSLLLDENLLHLKLGVFVTTTSKKGDGLQGVHIRDRVDTHQIGSTDSRISIPVIHDSSESNSLVLDLALICYENIKKDY
jgi:hypothetical protein